jgi:predicted transcriptional regulator of viral defense system
VRNIIHGKTNAFVILRNYQKKGYIKKIKHDLYATISMENSGLIASKYQIACAINESSFVSHHSAFEFYGYYNQVFNTINVSSLNHFQSFVFDGIEYQYFRSNLLDQIQVVRGVKVTSIERTIVDSIDDIDKFAGTEELIQCIRMIPFVSESMILEYLHRRASKLLYKKTGYVLSHFQNELMLSDEFFDICLRNGGNVVGYFSQIDKDGLIFDSRWTFYAYPDFMSFVGKKNKSNV